MPKRFMVWDRQNKVFLTQAMEIWQIVNHFQGRVGDLVNDDLSDRRYVFCQSTNLFAKDGKEIFEGSIVEVDENFNWGNGDNERHFFGEVVNYQGCWCVNSICGEDELMQPLYEIRTEDIKLTGHILSNPGLVEEQ